MTPFRVIALVSILAVAAIAPGLWLLWANRGALETVELSYPGYFARAGTAALRDAPSPANSVPGVAATDPAAPPAPREAETVAADDGANAPSIPASARLVVMNLVPALALIALLLIAAPPRRDSHAEIEIGKSPARQLAGTLNHVTFAEVAGIDEARHDLEEIVEFLRHPERFAELGGKVPSGVLLSGPPGTGKTLLARAIAGEAGVPFFAASGSDFVELFVGVGASRIRDTFERARAVAPAIVFIDEIDAVGRRRGVSQSGQQDEREQTLNQLLVEMDGVEGNRGVIVIGATNRPDVLDPALLRPGRFDRQVSVPVPDRLGRERILAVHLAKVPLDGAVEIGMIARGTPGFSGAELANLVNEAALLAARRGVSRVGNAELESARDKILLGPERRSLALSAEDRRRAAYHEAGHALVALAVPQCGPLHKVTILPRGRAIGTTSLLPERDRNGYSKAELEARIAMALGGRIAEQLVYGANRVSTAAADDLGEASRIARRMVTEFGFGHRLGRASLAAGGPISDATRCDVDDDVHDIVRAAEETARAALTRHIDGFHRAAAAIFERETLSGDEFRAAAGLERA